MKSKKIISLQRHRLNQTPVTYTIEVRHDGEGMSFMVYDIEDTQKDRLAVAIDLEAAATSLKEPG
jgi:nucleoside-triphosphatase THEP1